VEEVRVPTTFSLRATPGIQVAPVHATLQLGDASSRLRVIDAALDGRTYTLRVEGRRGRSYRVRLLAAHAISVDGAKMLSPADAAEKADGYVLQIDMPPADPDAAGAVLKRSDWATVTVTVHLGERLR
jgi:hypothetical protein